MLAPLLAGLVAFAAHRNRRSGRGAGGARADGGPGRDRDPPERDHGGADRRGRRSWRPGWSAPGSARCRSRRPISTSARATASTRTSTTGDCRRCASRTAGSRRGLGRTSPARRQRPGGDRPRAARLDPRARRGPGRRSRSTAGLATLIGVDRDGCGRVAAGRVCAPGCPPGLRSCRIGLGELGPLAASLGPGDLLIALAAEARAASRSCCPPGSPASGDGNLTSPSTRTDGSWSRTDIAPTVLERLGVEVPDEVNGQRDHDLGRRARPGGGRRPAVAPRPSPEPQRGRARAARRLAARGRARGARLAPARRAGRDCGCSR